MTPSVSSATTTTTTSKSSHSEYFEIREIPGRGQAMVAKQDLDPGIFGITILHELPLIISPLRGSTKDKSGPLPKSNGNKLTNFLNPQFWTDYWSYTHIRSKIIKEKIKLHYYNPQEASLYMKALQLILPKPYVINIPEFVNVIMVFRYNAASVQEGQGRGIYEYACRINHSCLPNCAWFDSQDGTNCRVVRLVVPIKKGQEFTVDYVESRMLPTHERRRKLQHSKGFLCDCDRCSSIIDTTRRFPCLHCNASTSTTTEDDDGVHFIERRPRHEAAGGGVASNGHGPTTGTQFVDPSIVSLSACTKCGQPAQQTVDEIQIQEEQIQEELNQLNVWIEKEEQLSPSIVQRIRGIQPPHKYHYLAGDTFFITQAKLMKYDGNKYQESIQLLRNRLECYDQILGSNYPTIITGMACELLADAIYEHVQVQERQQQQDATESKEEGDNNGVNSTSRGNNLFQTMMEAEQIYQRAVRIYQIASSGFDSTLSKHVMEKLYVVQNQLLSKQRQQQQHRDDDENHGACQNDSTTSSSSVCALCGAHAGKKCSRCGQVAYCCKDHQRAHWSTVHKKYCIVATKKNSTTEK